MLAPEKTETAALVEKPLPIHHKITAPEHLEEAAIFEHTVKHGAAELLLDAGRRVAEAAKAVDIALKTPAALSPVAEKAVNLPVVYVRRVAGSEPHAQFVEVIATPDSEESVPTIVETFEPNNIIDEENEVWFEPSETLLENGELLVGISLESLPVEDYDSSDLETFDFADLGDSTASPLTLWEQSTDQELAEAIEPDATPNIVELLTEYFPDVEIENVEVVEALFTEVLQTVNEYLVLDTEIDSSTAEAKQQDLLVLCEQLFVYLGIEYDEKLLHQFVHSLLQQEAEEAGLEFTENSETVDEGTHEKKLDNMVLIRLLAQLGDSRRPPMVRLGRLALQFKLSFGVLHEAA